MRFSNSVITFIRGDDDALLVGLTNGAVFELGDTVFFCLRARETDTSDVLQIASTDFTEYLTVANAGALVSIPHSATIDLPLGTYYYTIWIEWANGTFVTVVPPTRFALTPGGSHG